MNCQYCGFPLDEKKLCEHCSNLLTYSFDDLKFIMGDANDNSQTTTILTSVIDKGIHALEGLLFALQLDGNINSIIMEELHSWAEEYKNFIDIQPFTEAIATIKNPPESSFETLQIFSDILWVCNNLGFANKYHDMITSDLHILDTLIQEIGEETPLSLNQVPNLKTWQKTVKHFTPIYPYNEIIKILDNSLLANLFLNVEYQKLSNILNQFQQQHKDITEENLKDIKILCNLESHLTTTNIELEEKNICLTGSFSKIAKNDLIKILRSKNIYPLSNISPKTSYLVVGSASKSCWPFYSYGRKIEDVLTLKEQNHNIEIISEEQLLSIINKKGE